MPFNAPAVRRVALLAALVLPSVVLAQPASFTPEQREAIGGIVREYLVKNPEVLQEAFTELQRRQQVAEQAGRAEVLTAERGKLENSPHDFVLGNPQGDVTMVEFLDYNCGYCKRAVADVKALIKSDPKLWVVIKDFPVLGPGSIEASRVALAAKSQLTGDKLYEFHTKLMERRGPANGESAKAVAKEMGLDMARLEKDLHSDGIDATLKENMKPGERLGINGTPGFVIGNEVIAGAVGAEPLRQVIANTRK
ncbi:MULTISPECIES: DsbA family protein [Microvirga]|uniref:Thioredoxin domain-containing protein n=2 Tax=Microvirga TaxID=186650 RepID=A0ABW9Z1W6_9HYPH|nr:DsbA family protein [Microvirga arsenatis]NBJ12797.1 thioredoxin domain-containing protein [Microvirga arsenatis]NBJ26656.1 thioredoxin domain-containing protein [Microvirga arsenatis]